MAILMPAEKAFLDVFLHEATTAPFRGPATDALHAIGAEYADISFIVWAYEQDVPRSRFEWGHAAATAPPLPWKDRDAVLKRDLEIKTVRETRLPPPAPVNAPLNLTEAPAPRS